MKKTKYLALVLVVAIMMMGAGYAYWTETLVINSTVKTGKMNVRFSEASLVSVEKDEKYATTSLTPIGWNTKQLDLTVNKLYPGASYTFSNTVKNDGDIPAVLTLSMSEVSGNTISANKFKVEGKITVNGIYGIPVGSHEVIIPQTTLDNYMSQITSYLTYNRLEPNGTIKTDLTITLDKDIDNDLQDKIFKHKVTFNFTQHNQ